ncbi:hypothetical protein FQA39_LY04650 [Lamprigera yunnana]|nr:hypothetical protein FQA39_LY04650 [Lamprigera yunnana]
MWMLYAEQSWTKAIDLKSAVERLYEKLSALEFEKWKNITQLNNMNNYEINTKLEGNDSDTSSYSSDEEEYKALEENGESSKTTEVESKKSKSERITKPVS